jgi:3-oxoacyl-[acyl-carrier protein] reductase
MTSRQREWAIVTGGSSGIGRSCALELARAGWNVGIHYRRSKSAAEEVAQGVEAVGGEAMLVSADLGDPEAGPRLVEKFWEQTAGFSAWAHLAGADLLTGAESKWPFEKKLAWIVQVDLVGTMLCARAAGQRMKERGGGSIVTIGWDQSACGMEGDSGELFAGVKGGVSAFSRSLAKSLAPSVRVNCVAPGWIKTAWGEKASAVWQERACREAPLGRWGRPEDIAAAVEFLLSDRASFVTGQTININGGVVTS